MQKPIPIIQSARDAALSRFAEMANAIVSDADAYPEKTLPSPERRLSTVVRDFLRHDGAALSRRLVSFYRDYLERAMQTMYTDLRVDLHSLSAEHLSLIDDETMNNQIEVDRLVQRLRDADRENLGRLNIMISQLHEENEVRERENPFRPYLLARTLHDVLKDMVKDEAVRDVLFDHLAKAMIGALPGYYSAIRAVFESSGMRAKLIARPSMMSSAQRDMLARQAMQAWQPMAGYPAGSPLANGPPAVSEAQGFHDLLRKMFNLPKWSGKAPVVSPEPAAPAADQPAGESAALPAPASEELIAKLHRFQKKAAQEVDDGAGGDQAPEEHNQLFSLREALESEGINSQERVTMEVIALLFEFILRDELMPAAMREKMGRLQIPFLKAAMLSPDMLQKPDHPARRLLNRMGSLASGLVSETPESREIENEIEQVANKLLAGYDRDPAIFADCNRQLEQFVERRVQATAGHAVLQEALDEAETVSILMANISHALTAVMSSMTLDARLSEFILQTWTRVLVYAAHAQIREQEAAGGKLDLPQLALIPELIWSTQVRQTAQERSALMRFLPGLVANLRKNLQSTPLSEAEYQQALDRLVNLHTDVLRPGKVVEAQTLPTLESLSERFSSIVIDAGMGTWTGEGMAPIDHGMTTAAFARRKLEADLFVERDTLPVFASDREQIASFKPGIRIEYATGNDAGTAQLTGVGKQLSLYAFKPDAGEAMQIYSSAALIRALRTGVVRPLEKRALFERAVDSMMAEIGEK